MKVFKPLSLEQALYLAKEAGIVTKAEVQKLIITSPSFSPDISPFLLNNFLKGRTKEGEEVKESVDVKTQPENVEKIIKIEQNSDIAKIDQVIASKINPAGLKLFWHNNSWWNVYSEGVGTCLRSTSHVILKRGSGMVKINNEEDVYSRWPLMYNRMDVLEPFYLSGCACVYDLYIKTQGGGTTGQSRATRLAVARALVNANSSMQEILKDALYEDIRQRMPKMPGRITARALRKWSKR
ncbi:ribosomal protein S9, putative [Theileria equi strain WA]|uniref:Ribosomal protein S9, putative n=1 Tax=Theileria equi strain WA TaxID=1537102 RepID=L1LCK9_THEEQ|nr:ribosomal protein S9, putative [Theileria equi strain WA]EKX73172.1 ribosomal protein S9, putative [Theileria equi strain WA]|eukprot:XP_004832624.1 ribosomal protein S9, putative [Theileria equi strain WA]